MDTTQQEITPDDDSTIEVQRQLERMCKEIDKHRRRRTMTRPEDRILCGDKSEEGQTRNIHGLSKGEGNETD